MSLPLVAIVGRPNVGKSSLLNLLALERISIVDPRPGITRDRVTAILEHRERYAELVDTGGVGVVDADHLEQHVEEQIRFAIQRAALVLFVVDCQSGVTPLDQRVAELLRKSEKRVLVIANKADTEAHEPHAGVFARLGFGPALAVSALHSRGRDPLLDWLFDALGDAFGERPEQPIMRLAIVGKRNAGKSTLVNALAGEPRMIVSEIPGTTRDAVDVRFERDGKVFIAIDTAGVRKRRSMNDIDFYSYTRALRAIRMSDVALHLIDAEVPISDVDLKLIGAVQEEHKPLLLAINKWDLAEGRATPAQFDEYLEQAIPALPYVPVTFMTARTGRNVQSAIDVALSLHEQARTRLPTARLNAVLEEVLSQRVPAAKRGSKPVRIYFATQIDVAPPTFVFSCNNPDGVTDNYRRFLENRLREQTPFREIPMRLLFRSHHGESART